MSKAGILIINTGTPDEPTEDAIRRYLGDFLIDPCLMRFPKPLRWFVVHGFILPRRPRVNVPRYERIWEPTGSAFMRISLEQLFAIREEMARRGFNGGDFQVELAMRYGNPNVMNGFKALLAGGCEQIFILPLYPQNVTVCGGTVLREVHRCVQVLRILGNEFRPVFIPQYYDQPAYIRELANSVRQNWPWFEEARAKAEAAGEPLSLPRHVRMVTSYHSTFERDIEAGDPYVDQIRETRDALAAELGIAPINIDITFQSAFGKKGWLGPDLKKEAIRWGREGVTELCVMCPGFSADNLETLVEIGEELRDTYLGAAAAAGHEAHYTYVPALNAAPGNIEAMCSAICEAFVGVNEITEEQIAAEEAKFVED